MDKRLALLAAVYLGACLPTLAFTTVNVALPAIQRTLAVDLAGQQWVVGAYALCLSAFMLSAGPVGDRYGRKRVWLAGIVLFTLGSAASAASSSLPWLLAGQAVQGVGGALLIPGALSILAQAYPDPAARASVIGGWASFLSLSLVLGPLLGGLLVDGFGWPSIFLINLPVGAATLVIGISAVPESADPDHAALDGWGQMLGVLLLGTLTFGLIRAGQAGWRDGLTLAALAAALAAAVSLVMVERRARAPLVPLDLFADRPFAAVNFAAFGLGFSGYASLFLLSLFLQGAKGYGAGEAGWRVAPMFGAMGLLAFFFGPLRRRLPARWLMVVGLGLVGGAMLSMGAFSALTPDPVAAILFVVLGIGMGLAMPAISAAAMEGAPRHRSGIVSATMNVLRQGGMTVGIALLGSVLHGRAAALFAAGLPDGIADPASAASLAVGRREMAPGLGLSGPAFQALLADAVASGCALALALGGAVAILAALAVAASGPPRRAVPRPDARAGRVTP